MERSLTLSRGLAILVDRFFLSIVSIILSPILLLVPSIESSFVAALMAFYFGQWILSPIYFTIMEGGYGKTLGKHLFKLEVVRKDNSELNYNRSIIRNLIRPIDHFPIFYVVGLIFIAFTKGKRLGDIAAGTKVVYSD